MISGKPIDWSGVKRVLVVRLRSIGDTVLATPALMALRRALPDATIDVLLEDWVAPVLEGFRAADEVIAVRGSDPLARLALARELRRRKYDVAVNLHGGTTSTFFVRATGAPIRIGYAHYRYAFLHSHRLSSSADFWGKPVTHSAEQQLALVGAFGIPVGDRPKTTLAVTESAAAGIERKFRDSGISDSRFQHSKIPDSRISEHSESETNPKSKIENPKSPGPKSKIQNPKSKIGRSKIENPRSSGAKSKIALLHPVAAFETKQWAVEKFAEVARFLDERGFRIVAVGASREMPALDELKRISTADIEIFSDLMLPEITALAAASAIFVGNDSGIGHIAAAVGCPTVVIFGSSNRNHWRPWTDTPHQVVFEPFDCQPCAGYRCEKFDSPRCIESVTTESVTAAIESLLS